MQARAIQRLTGIAALLCCAACAPSKSQLEQVMERGELRVVTRNGPTTYFIDRDGATGIEYEMAQRFAGELGVRLTVIVARSAGEVIGAVKSGIADIATAGLTRNVIEKTPLAAARNYHWVTHQVVYRNGGRVPESVDDIFPNQLHLIDGSIPAPFLEALRSQYPRLSWYIHKSKDSDDLLDMVEAGKIAYTVLPSNELAHARQIRPEIRAALNLTPPQPIAWAVKKSNDSSLLRAMDAFVESMEKSGELGKMLERFYGSVESFDYVDSREFVERLTERLPGYRGLFERVAAEFNLDWRLLAAISYQESHWQVDARSPTGVRGLMMLTTDTARRVGIRNRLDPEQSLRGGAIYLNELMKKIPQRITEPDRTWFALAAYNVGFGHLEDARILTQKQGADADHWQDVRERLPLLTHKSWYEQTRHGYARGHEPVRFVRRIRKYYSALVQLTQPESTRLQQIVEADPLKAPVL